MQPSWARFSIVININFGSNSKQLWEKFEKSMEDSDLDRDDAMEDSLLDVRYIIPMKAFELSNHWFIL